MRVLSMIGLLCLSACGDPDYIPRDAFPSTAGQVICERLRECSRGVFDRDYFGMKDCVHHHALALREIDEFFDNLGCDYSEDGAARAWRNVQSMSCEDIHTNRIMREYDRVWDCR